MSFSRSFLLDSLYLRTLREFRIRERNTRIPVSGDNYDTISLASYSQNPRKYKL